MAKGRWNYMSRLGFNPPSDACPQCQTKSKTYHVGDKTVEGHLIQRFMCENGHTWITHGESTFAERRHCLVS